VIHTENIGSKVSRKHRILPTLSPGETGCRGGPHGIGASLGIRVSLVAGNLSIFHGPVALSICLFPFSSANQILLHLRIDSHLFSSLMLCSQLGLKVARSCLGSRNAWLSLCQRLLVE
jgi:hypothetical protein